MNKILFLSLALFVAETVSAEEGFQLERIPSVDEASGGFG